MTFDNRIVKESGKIIVVTSAKGGVGKSIFASNLAVALSSSGANVAIMDNMFQFSDLYILFDKKYKYNLNDVLNNFTQIDYETIGLYLMKYSKKNLFVLPGPKTPEEGEFIDEEKYLKLVDLLAEKMEYVIIDSSAGFSDINIDILDQAEKIFLVSTNEINSIINTKKHMKILEKMNIENKLSIVLNKYKKRDNLNRKQISEILDKHMIFYLPKADRLIERSINIGIPTIIVKNTSVFSKQITRIAKYIMEDRTASKSISNRKEVI